MPLMTIEDTSVLEKIDRVENGLMPAVSIQGASTCKKNLIEEMKETQVPAASIAVINEGKIEWAKAYGVLSANENLKANPQTRFQAGSVSKPVAAFGILSLFQKGLIDLDEDVNRKLVSWQIPDNEYTSVQKVTLRHLLSHTSGLSVIGFDGYAKNQSIPTITQTLDGLEPANNSPIRVEFVPFSKMSYSGGGYNVAQQLAEDVAQMPFKQFMKATLFDPLEMHHSTFEHLDFEKALNVARAHPFQGLPMEGGWKTYPESAAAGLWTTPTDLAKWLIEIQETLTPNESARILNQEIVDAMVTPQVAVYGLGPVVNGEGGELELSHKGTTDGFTCGFVSFPYLKQGAVVMINASNGLALVEDVFRSIACEYNWPSYSIKVKETIDLPVEALGKYVGRYGWGDTINDIYDLFIIQKENHLFWKIGSASPLRKLYPEAENCFFFLDTGYDVVFEESSGVITGLTIIVQPGFEREFKKFG